MKRVLHVLGSLDRGGAEVWLMHMLRATDPARYRFDFLVHRREEGTLEAEARHFGARVFRQPLDAGIFSYARGLRRILREEGPFDVLHSHVHLFSGVVLAVGAAAGVPQRISHAHNDTRLKDFESGLKRRAYRKGMQRMIGLFGTGGAACARGAGEDVFGEQWHESRHWRRVYCGIDLAAFENETESDCRAELGIDPEAPTFGLVGRFSAQKNHAFLLRIFSEILAREPRARFVLVGDGELRSGIEEEARRLLGAAVVFTGVRSDVHRLLRTFDCQVMPSLHEGLPLAVLEAQAAGTTTLLSRRVTEEVVIVPSLVKWGSLEESPAQWADAALGAAREARAAGPRAVRHAVALAQVSRSKFALRSSHEALLGLYDETADTAVR